MSRRWRLLARGSVTVVCISLVAIASAVILTDPEPGKLLTDRGRLRAAVWPTGLSGASAAAAKKTGASNAPTRVVPLFSDDWYDDSGFSFTTAFSTPVTDPTSLEQVRSALEGRARRGVAHLERTLREVSPSAPDARAHTSRLNLIIGSLRMFDGEFAEAEACFTAALKAEPSGSEMLRANMEALLGVAALRRGETENCVACRNEASCLFPIAPEARHLKPSGSREAMRRFIAYLGKRPEDIGVRWLLNVAAMTVGEYPGGVPSEYVIPLEPFRSRVDIGRFVNVSARVALDSRGPSMAGGCVVDDFDGDGRLDVFFSTSDPSSGASLFINKGDGTFEDRSTSAGLADQVAALNVKQADFDNDGRLDVLLLRGGWEQPRRPTLLRNTGGGVFADVTVAAGLVSPISSQSAAWGDFDNDGWLDVYVAGEFDPERPDLRNRGRLYRNNGDGTFTDVAERAGVRNERYGKGADWGDYDNDGDLDLYVSNLGQPNRLYRNNGDGTFTDAAPELHVTEPLFGFACWFWDYDNDGRLDLYVNPYAAKLGEIVRSHLGLPTGGERPRLYHNEGARGFRDATAEAGLDRVLVPMGSNFGDLDNDGYLDMYLGTGRPPYAYLVPNVMFKNMGGRRFEDVTTSTGTGHLQKGHGVAFADWDEDGDVDVFLESGGATPGDKAGNLLFLNPGHGNHWLNVKLVGVTTNRSALGARIQLDLDEPDGTTSARHRVVTSGGSFGGNPLATTIGLGRAARVAALKVTWPTSKTVQVFRDLPVDRMVEITEGSPEYRTRERKPIRLPAAP